MGKDTMQMVVVVIIGVIILGLIVSYTMISDRDAEIIELKRKIKHLESQKNNIEQEHKPKPEPIEQHDEKEIGNDGDSYVDPTK